MKTRMHLTVKTIGKIRCFRRGLASFFLCACMLLIFSSPLAAATPPVVNSTSIDYSSNQITIVGQSFAPTGVAPIVTFGSGNLVLVSFTSQTIVARLPVGTVAGSYRLRVTQNSGSLAYYELSVTFGAVGPQGPIGPTGSQGPAGPMGPSERNSTPRIELHVRYGLRHP